MYFRIAFGGRLQTIILFSSLASYFSALVPRNDIIWLGQGISQHNMTKNDITKIGKTAQKHAVFEKVVWGADELFS
jgi:hypothetical protein